MASDNPPENKEGPSTEHASHFSDESDPLASPSRLVNKAQNHLHEALNEEKQIEKNYHIRSALQMLTLEDGELTD